MLYGSLQNRMMERIEVVPVVGMGVTECYYSDCVPFEVIEVVNEKCLKIRRMDCTRKEGSDFYDNDWNEPVSNPDGMVKEIYKDRKGVWREKNRWIDENGKKHWSFGCNGFSIGFARRSVDPSF